MSIQVRRKYSLAQLPAVLRRLEHDPIPKEELERRQRLLDEAEQLRQQMLPITVPVEELIRQEQEGKPGG